MGQSGTSRFFTVSYYSIIWKILWNKHICIFRNSWNVYVFEHFKWRIITFRIRQNIALSSPKMQEISFRRLPISRFPGLECSQTPLASYRAFVARNVHRSFHKLATPLLSTTKLYFYKYIFCTFSCSWGRMMYNLQVSWLIHIAWNRPVFPQSVILLLL